MTGRRSLLGPGSRFARWTVAVLAAALGLVTVGAIPAAAALPGQGFTAWASLSPATSPPARSAASITYDAAAGNLVLFGGLTGSANDGGTWTWNGSTWTQRALGAPPARNDASMAYDPATGQVVLFGGQNTTGFLDDTWTWDGSNWTEQDPTTSPPPRAGAALAYDPAISQMLLVGGNGGTGVDGGTWAWNGTTWSNLNVSVAPPTFNAALAYDGATGKMVLFGGQNSNGLLGNTYLWTGTAWQKQNPSAAPSARASAGLAYDANTSQLLLFGGQGSGGALGDTWLWTGTTWSSTTTGPPARSGAAMAYDGTSGQVVLFAGQGATAQLDDTWEWGTPPTITSGIAATFAAGTPGSVTVTTSSSILPALTETGALPAGVTFVDNGNGTATLGGTPAHGTAGTYVLSLEANDGVPLPFTEHFTLTVDQAPAITSADATTFTSGQPGTFTVTATGSPTPTVTAAETLPTGVTFTDNHDGTATLAGTPSGAPGPYNLTITASNGVGSTTSQAFTLTVDQAPAITNAATSTFTTGQPGTFTVTTTGFPTPALAESGALPGGVTFTDSGEGTATLTGTPSPSTGGTYPFTITASNSVGSGATQTFVLTVDQAPGITSADATTFTAGQSGSFTVASTGFPTPALSESGGLPAGLGFSDNGDGTASLAGTPGLSSGGPYDLSLTAANAVTPNATEAFTLTVDQAPAITSTGASTFTAGQPGTFTVMTTGFPAAAVTESGALPGGLSFNPGTGGTATLSGSPVSGTGGTYAFTITASNGVTPVATQSFMLTVNESPVITSGDSTTFTAGQAGTFTVSTTGFPTAALTETGSLPNGVTFTDNGNSSATLAGIPASATGGTYPLTISASNGVGAGPGQPFTLTVDQAPAFTSAAGTTFISGDLIPFTVTTTGFPTATITEAGPLPPGVTFTDNGDGTATLTGRPLAGNGGVYGMTITASNGVAYAATQAFDLTVWDPSIITSADSATFTVGSPGSFTVTTAGFPTAALSVIAGQLPTGVTFTDNGDGTATLAGAAAPGTAGTYPVVLLATNIPGGSSQDFTLTVSLAPTTTALTVEPSATYGDSVAYTAEVSGNPGPPTGTVTFTTGSTTLCTAPVEVTGTASCPSTAAPAGTDLVTGAYSGDDSYAASSGTAPLDVARAQLTITASGGSMTYGSPAPAIMPSYSGFVNGDGAGSLTTQPSCSANAGPTSPVGTYASTCPGASDPNYTISSDPGTVTVDPATLVVTANDASRLFGFSNPAFTATISGFVNGQDLSTSGVTGQAACMTTANATSPATTYPITCGVGSLAATNYSFGFAPGVLTVLYSAACITGTHTGPLNVAAGQSLCIGPGAKVTGPVTVAAGGALSVTGATLSGPFRVDGGAVRVCGTTITGPVDVSSSPAPVVIGDNDGPTPCAGNTITGPVSLTDNTAGVELDGNTITGPVTISGTTGTLPPPDTGSVDATGNKITGPLRVS